MARIRVFALDADPDVDPELYGLSKADALHLLIMGQAIPLTRRRIQLVVATNGNGHSRCFIDNLKACEWGARWSGPVRTWQMVQKVR